jgi:hypothetical protein
MLSDLGGSLSVLTASFTSVHVHAINILIFMAARRHIDDSRAPSTCPGRLQHRTTTLGLVHDPIRNQNVLLRVAPTQAGRRGQE